MADTAGQSANPEDALIAKVEGIMEKTMAKYDPSHDHLHVNRVRKTALAIAATVQPTPDLLVVELAALMHDLLDKKYVSAEIAADPYKFFEPIFTPDETSGHLNLLTDGRAKTIAQIVDNVSWTTEKRLRKEGKWGKWHDECVELHCVQDADRLDAIGAFGIMRCAAYSSATNHPLHTPEDDPAHEGSAIQHFHDKLLHIRDRLKTDAGKRMGEKRHQFMLQFLSEVNGEYAGEIP